MSCEGPFVNQFLDFLFLLSTLLLLLQFFFSQTLLLQGVGPHRMVLVHYTVECFCKFCRFAKCTVQKPCLQRMHASLSRCLSLAMLLDGYFLCPSPWLLFSWRAHLKFLLDWVQEESRHRHVAGSHAHILVLCLVRFPRMAARDRLLLPTVDCVLQV